MLELLFALGPLYTSALILGCVVLLFAARRVYVDYRIRTLGGVRAPVLGTNPITGKALYLRPAVDTQTLTQPGLPFFIKAGYYQTINRLDYYYNTLFDNATPECPNCVEIAFTGRIRFLMTREPEHIKTILTSKFAEYGKGERFHEIWSPFLGDSIFTTDGQLWSDSRALIRPMFIKDKVRDLDIFDKWARTLISKLPAEGAVGTVWVNLRVEVRKRRRGD